MKFEDRIEVSTWFDDDLETYKIKVRLVDNDGNKRGKLFKVTREWLESMPIVAEGNMFEQAMLDDIVCEQQMTQGKTILESIPAEEYSTPIVPNSLNIRQHSKTRRY